jgi:hypothetical protein
LLLPPFPKLAGWLARSSHICFPNRAQRDPLWKTVAILAQVCFKRKVPKLRVEMEAAIQMIKASPEKAIAALLKDAASRKQIVKTVSKLVSHHSQLHSFQIRMESVCSNE